ncbi:MAG: hypothetical protein CVU77_06605 [Elusimicrobia bacterium HGW-Elusimicrobia-1]|jgi:adenylate cyclase|nr:MAG: hypothetical protein CVU77_06605 [Elusimicrobia bacterium HGW-Elusimicrobia-1]
MKMPRHFLQTISRRKSATENLRAFRPFGAVSAAALLMLIPTACAQKKRALTPADEPRVAIIAVDGKTIRTFGSFPLKRGVYADCVDALTRHSAAIIAINILFDLPSSHGRQEDERFARAIGRAGNVILLATADEEKIIYPIGALKKNARAVAHGEMWTGNSMRVKGIAPLARASDKVKFIPALAFAVAREYIGVKEPMSIEGNSLAAVLLFGMPLHVLKLGNMSVPLYNGGLAKISYKGPAGSIETFSLADVVSGKIGAEKIRGRICFVGYASPGGDHETPVGIMSGTEAQANAAITVINHLRAKPATGFRANAAVTVINHLRAPSPEAVKTR